MNGDNRKIFTNDISFVKKVENEGSVTNTKEIKISPYKNNKEDIINHLKKENERLRKLVVTYEINNKNYSIRERRNRMDSLQKRNLNSYLTNNKILRAKYNQAIEDNSYLITQKDKNLNLNQSLNYKNNFTDTTLENDNLVNHSKKLSTYVVNNETKTKDLKKEDVYCRRMKNKLKVKCMESINIDRRNRSGERKKILQDTPKKDKLMSWKKLEISDVFKKKINMSISSSQRYETKLNSKNGSAAKLNLVNKNLINGYNTVSDKNIFKNRSKIENKSKTIVANNCREEKPVNNILTADIENSEHRNTETQKKNINNNGIRSKLNTLVPQPQQVSCIKLFDNDAEFFSPEANIRKITINRKIVPSKRKINEDINVNNIKNNNSNIYNKQIIMNKTNNTFFIYQKSNNNGSVEKNNNNHTNHNLIRSSTHKNKNSQLKGQTYSHSKKKERINEENNRFSILKEGLNPFTRNKNSEKINEVNHSNNYFYYVNSGNKISQGNKNTKTQERIKNE